MNPIDAFYHTVHDHPGGAASLAPRMGMSAAVLCNKADPKKECNKPLLIDVDKVMGLTGDFRILQALAHKHGFLLIKAPDGTEECDMSVLESVMETGVAHGQFMQSIHAALSDGRVDKKEVEAISEAERALQTAAATTTRRMKGMVG